jgi:PST family polysaccharide transporter
MRWGVFAFFMQLAALFVGLPYGPSGVVTTYVVCMFILFIPALVYAGKPLMIGAADVLRHIWRPLTGTALAVVVGFTLRATPLAPANPIGRTVVLASAFALVYLVMVVGVLRLRTPLEIIPVLAGSYLPAWAARLLPVRYLSDARGYEHP